MAKKVWDNCKFIGEVQKTGSTKYKVELVARDGVKYINIREWYKRKRDNEYKPGRNGIAVPIEIPINEEVTDVISEFMRVVGLAINESNDFELEDEENAVYRD